MKKLLLGIAAVCLAGFTFAQDAPLWMRHSVISPDGTTIAFTSVSYTHLTLPTILLV